MDPNRRPNAFDRAEDRALLKQLQRIADEAADRRGADRPWTDERVADLRAELAEHAERDREQQRIDADYKGR